MLELKNKSSVKNQINPFPVTHQKHVSVVFSPRISFPCSNSYAVTHKHWLLEWITCYPFIQRGHRNRCCCCCCWVTSVVPDSVRPHRRQPTRLPRPWDSPGKKTGVGCHFLLQCMKVKSESRSVVSDPQRHHGLQPSGLLHPWDFPGKSTRVGCHCLLWKLVLVATKHLAARAHKEVTKFRPDQQPR